jgi:hypothetical protein
LKEQSLSETALFSRLTMVSLAHGLGDEKHLQDTDWFEQVVSLGGSLNPAKANCCLLARKLDFVLKT